VLERILLRAACHSMLVAPADFGRWAIDVHFARDDHMPVFIGSGSRVMRQLLASAITGIAMSSTRLGAQQPAGAPAPHDHRLFACNTDDLARGASSGCQLIAQPTLSAIGDGPTFWHLATFATSREAEAAKRPSDVLVEAAGKIWVFRFGPRGDTLARGTRVASIGPLPMPRASAYQVDVYHVVMPAGMHTKVHMHHGPEAWYVLEGEQCLETPLGVIKARAGAGTIAPPGGTPMQLTNNGAVARRALFIVIHDPALPFTVPSAWHPTGSCGTGRHEGQQ
jgi:quercetin dioxygenase-like cupin family protein